MGLMRLLKAMEDNYLENMKFKVPTVVPTVIRMNYSHRFTVLSPLMIGATHRLTRVHVPTAQLLLFHTHARVPTIASASR